LETVFGELAYLNYVNSHNIFHVNYQIIQTITNIHHNDYSCK